jgi:integrase
MIRKLKSGKYQARIDNGFDKDGKRSRVTGESRRTKKEAQADERQLLKARDDGHSLVTSNVTVVQLIEEYIAACERRGLAAKTTEEYAGVKECRYARLVSAKAAKWRPGHVNEWVALLLERGGKKGGPLSAKSVCHAMTLGNAAYEFGKQRELVRVNPFDNVTRPKVKKSPAKMLTQAELRRLQEVAHGTRWIAFITVALWLGPRRGESIALDWSAYKEDEQTLSIHCAIAQTPKRGVHTKGTKTETTRELPIPARVRAAFQRQRALQAADELAAIPGTYQQTGAIFTDELGRRYTPMAATCAFSRLAKKAKLSTTRLHDLRHHAASELLGTGANQALVAELMGHTIETLLRTYAHARPDSKRERREAIDKLSARLESAERDAS